MDFDDVVKAWDEAPLDAIHPSRIRSEEAYWESGQIQAQQLAEIIPLLEKDGVSQTTVIDYGCGDGRVAIPLMGFGYEVVGVDSSPKMLDAFSDNCLSQNLSPVFFNIERRDQTPLTDALYCLAVLIHHSFKDGEQMIRDMASRVRSGGLLILDWPGSTLYSHEATYWNDVTTWDVKDQVKLAERLNLIRLEYASPYKIFRVP